MKKRIEAPPLPPMTLAKVLDPNGRNEAERRVIWRRMRGLKRFFVWCAFMGICGATGLSWAEMFLGPEKVAAVFKGDWVSDAFGGGSSGSMFSFDSSSGSSSGGSSSGGSAATPEPSSIVLAAIGAAVGGAAMIRRRRRSPAA